MIKICDFCGKEFEVWGSSLTCSPACSVARNRKNAREYQKKLREGLVKKSDRAPIIKTCDYCGESFESQTPNAKYCSPSCAKQTYSLRKENRRAEREKNLATAGAIKANFSCPWYEGTIQGTARSVHPVLGF